MPSLQHAFAEILARIDRPGDYFAAGTIDMYPPRLSVAGVGTVALPLLPAQAEQLLAVAEQAPYGRGTETLVDTDVRRTWQIDAGRIRLEGKRWADGLARILRAVTGGLGVHGVVEAELYKLLIYDAGAFFVSHRDSEKAPGMFGTLVLALPSAYSGGELVIRHKHHEATVDLHRDEPSELAYAAFYADCRHEVLPVTAGHRCVLVYNLLRRDGGPLPQVPDHDRERGELAALLRDWAAADPGADMPHKLICPLEHSYTEAELGFAALKGVDAAMAGVMLGAAADADCDLQLAMLTISESGSAEHIGGGYWRDDDDADFEIGEVLHGKEGQTTFLEWRTSSRRQSRCHPPIPDAALRRRSSCGGPEVPRRARGKRGTGKEGQTTFLEWKTSSRRQSRCHPPIPDAALRRRSSCGGPEVPNPSRVVAGGFTRDTAPAGSRIEGHSAPRASDARERRRLGSEARALP
ncbi:2OG-Fe(II) oxygenase [Thiohalocapsa sp. ML1]|uniref:2OG-Fe(II) oxygenase n=1 Tax=Thiohalocapsa sp. ML1 TaxID=1431688 RepID=UPI000732232C|nr:2OG-Fe(II) oxygenase [Thiohalocapsa sp. ML1]